MTLQAEEMLGGPSDLVVIDHHDEASGDEDFGVVVNLADIGVVQLECHLAGRQRPRRVEGHAGTARRRGLNGCRIADVNPVRSRMAPAVGIGREVSECPGCPPPIALHWLL